MKTKSNIIFRAATVVLLLFNLMGAFYGGIGLVMHPDGSSIQLSPDLLERTPFRDYLVPGIMLIATNGLFCTVVLIATLRNVRNSGTLVIAQGLILTGWIVIQVLLIRTVFFLHFLMGGTGIILVILGMLQRRARKKM